MVMAVAMAGEEAAEVVMAMAGEEAVEVVVEEVAV
jgi:phosphoribosyl-ATP pyrophosphohydrolase